MINNRELRKRDLYLKKLIAFQDTEPVKVITVCQLTIVLDALAELSVEVGPAKLIISQSRLRAGR